MPYGGLKASGIGQEGPRSAVAEMTDTKTVILHGRPWYWPVWKRKDQRCPPRPCG